MQVVLAATGRLRALVQEGDVPLSGAMVSLKISELERFGARFEFGSLQAPLQAETNQDGRIADLLDEPLEIGSYQLAFDVAAYFRELDGDVPFLSRVAIDFEILDSDRHYHIPLLLSRYACSSYRGS